MQPRKRTLFWIEDKTKRRALIGVILVPEPKREYADRAWNRITDLRNKLLNFERDGYSGGTIACVILQVWEEDEEVVLIPLKELTRVKEFRDKGSFHVKKDAGEFFLVTPRWDDNIKLRNGLEDIFTLL